MSGFPGSMLLNESHIRAQSATKIHPLGTRGYTRDGRAFRYSQASEAIVGGYLCQMRAAGTWSDDQNFDSSYCAGTTKVVMQMVSTGAPSSEDSTGYWTDGYLLVNDETGEGQLTQIKQFRGWTTGSTGGLSATCYLYDDGLKQAVSTGSECGLNLNPYAKLEESPKSMTGAPAGVAPIDVTKDYYFWLQTWGPAAIFFGGTGVDGYQAIPDAGTNTGFVTVKTSESSVSSQHLYPVVGNVMEVGASGEVGIIDLKLAP